MFKPSCVLTLNLALGLALPIQADVVWLKNGNSLEGRTRQLENGELEITSALGTLSLPAELIDRVVGARSEEERVREELDALEPGDADGRYHLALRIGGRGHQTLANNVLDQVLALDPEHAGARERLGYVRCEERWLKTQQCHELRGHIFYQGEWLPAAEVAQRRALSAQLAEARILESTLRLQSEAIAAEAYRRETTPYPGYGQVPYYLQYGLVVGSPPSRPGHPNRPFPRPQPVQGPSAPVARAPQHNSSSFRLQAPARPAAPSAPATLGRQ